MSSTQVFILIFALGIIAGSRTFTPPAMIAVAAHLKWIYLQHTILSFMGWLFALIIISILCVSELVVDKLPGTPSRKMPGPFIARVLSGAFAGFALSLATNHSVVAAVIIGGIGAAVGTLVGYELRTSLVKMLNVPDFVIALLEDAIAIGGGLFIVSRFLAPIAPILLK